LQEQIKKILRFYVLSNIHVAASLVSLYLIFNKLFNFNYIIFVFSATILTYSLIRMLSFGSNRFFIRRFYIKNKELIISLLLLFFISSSYSFIKLDILQKIWLIPFFLLSFFYNLNIKKIPFGKLRTNGIVKILIVALVWSGLIIIIPQLQGFKNTQVLFHSIFVFIYILVLTMSFDQRDVLIDNPGLKTIPQIYKQHIHYFYAFFGLILIGLSFLIFTNYQGLLISNTIILLSIGLCFNSDKHKSFYYTAFWIEGLPILWLILIKLFV